MTIVAAGGSPDLAPSPPVPTPPQRLVAGRFRLVEQLGRGGMGRVYRAHDEVLDRPVAVKLIYDDAVRDRELRHACALEARAAARLNHPGIVRILDSGFDDGHCYVVMSLAEGRTLSEILREDGPLPVDRALDLAIQVADALAAAHREGVIHCDVKPGNLLVDASWRIRLVDFGIARIASGTTGLTGELLQGSAQYVAPEQVEGASVDGRTDLYALGTVVYEMLAGQTPFGGGTIASILARRLVNDPPSLRETAPSVPPRLEQVILRALARDPEQRIQTATELRDDLMAIRQATPIFPIPERRRGQKSGLSHWHRVGSLGAALPWLSLEQARTAMRAGVAQATAWTGRTGQWAREVGGTVVPDAMTRAHLLTPAHRPTLRAGVGIAVLVGLLVGTTAAKCGVASVSADATLAAESAAVTVEQTVFATPTLVMPPPPPADNTVKEGREDNRDNLSNAPRSDEKTPEEREKAEAKKNEEEKRAEPKPAGESMLAPVTRKPEPPRPEPTRQQPPASKPRSPPPPMQQPQQIQKPQGAPPAVQNTPRRSGGDDRAPSQPRGNRRERSGDD